MMQKGLWVLVCSVFLMCICYQINLFEFKGIQETYDMDMVDETYSKEMFQRISNDTDMFVYSAYFDYRAGHIRVIGVSALKNATAVYCILRYNNKSPSYRYLRGHIMVIPDHLGRKYKAVYVICQLNGHKPPSTLTISKNKDFRSDDNILPVHLIPTTFPTMRNFTVCLSPLHNNFSKNMQLLEWLEMTMLLGVDKVDIYVHSCSSDVMTRLQMYQSSEFITIINWPLPKYLCNTYLLHYCGQLAALNDCLYRTKGYSKYIAVMDIDELIIPQKHEDMTWNDILHRLPSKNAYVFRNVIFIRNKSREKTEGNLITQANTLRHTLVFQTFDRSKYIAKADNVETLGIHFVRTMNGSHYSVDPSIGLLHHYRWKGVPGIKINTVQHQVANKYSHELRKRIYLQLNNTNCSRVL
ncbi:uncharacterized protein LOC123528776 isoform X2 [Mercenaria mercenaria]|nr:uncharacterized protein LOC123528776 isoform X2 [Mercenaria mercenaria]XP_053377727.1 uncharacterized protein LOC123528776 isoform X2 [Mercenaria mercenaria]XP_053377728.1 uncharacterized protein LOC123528776 isoform X2 [Mercenaria mercenaria]